MEHTRTLFSAAGWHSGLANEAPIALRHQLSLTLLFRMTHIIYRHVLTNVYKNDKKRGATTHNGFRFLSLNVSGIRIALFLYV